MQPSLITLNDAITDSPVYRANVQHYDDQLELLDRWLDALAKQLKLYCEKLNKFNLETNTLCKKAMPVGIGNALIDPHFTGAVIKSFSDALQTSLAFKTKLVSDLEDHFIQPLQHFVKTQLKDFKEFRKHHERALERYEAQLNKYATQSKTKEVSALREEAFRLHEARKYYIHMSGQHVVRMLHFRSDLEHTLVDLFSGATMAHLNDFGGGVQVWQKLDHQLASWKQWIVDDKDTCNYQLHKLQTMRRELENEYINQTQPPRDLDKYAPPTLGLLPQSPMNNRLSLDLSQEWTPDQHTKPYHKWGYLFTRNARGYWTRRWFFLYDGHFGSCVVHASPQKLKGAISLEERVSVLLSEIKPMVDIDRRYCFEIVSVQQASIVVQAETEDEMKDWISAFDKAKQIAIKYQQLPAAPVSAASHAKQDDATNNSESASAASNGALVPKITTTPATDTTFSSANVNANAPDQAQQPQQHEHHSIVVLSTSADNDRVSLANSTSLTPLLVWESARAAWPVRANQPFLDSHHNDGGPDTSLLSPRLPANKPPNGTNNGNSSSSWGIPWTLVPSMFQSGGGTGSGTGNDNVPPTTPVSNMPSSPHFAPDTDIQVIWPSHPDDTAVPKVDLHEYTHELEQHNKELRRVFGGVAHNEVVIDAFICCLKRPPNTGQKDHLAEDVGDDLEWPTTPIGTGSPLEQLEQELQTELSHNVRPPTSQFGYSYTGRAFVTQETFWLYSCVVMSCVHTVAVRLKDIQKVRLIRDPSIANTGKQSNIALAIDFCQDTQSDDVSPREPLILVSLMDDVEIVAEKLRIAVDNAKSKDMMPLQTMYDILHNMSVSMSKHKNAANVTTIIKTEPVTKQHSAPDMIARRPRSSSTGEIRDSPSSSVVVATEPSASPLPSASASFKLDRIRRGKRKDSNSNKKNQSHTATPPPQAGGALAAAMMAATQAGAGGICDLNKINGNATQTDASTAKLDAPTHDDLPAHITPPKGPIGCDCSDHLEKMEYETDLPVSAKTLYDLLFSEEKTGAAANGGIWQQKTQASGSRELQVGAWGDVDGHATRLLKYIMPVNNPMVKAKEADVVETQVLLKKEEYMRYCVQISTKSAQLPYADAFIPSIRYCISWVGPTQCHLSVCLGVKFVKNILVKSMVMKAAMKGMSESITQFMPMVVDNAQALSGTPANKRVSSLQGPAANAKDAKSMKNAIGAVSPAAAPASTPEGWLGTLVSVWEMVQDIASSLPLTATAIVAGLLSVWLLWATLSSSTSSSSLAHGKHHAFMPQRKVVSRAVYLRDVEDGLLTSNATTTLFDPSELSYQMFLQAKLAQRNVTMSTTMDRWHSKKHYSVSVELLYSRERIAMLRHDTLVIFSLLNQVDAQLLENEYVNWLLDARLECHATVTEDNAIKCEAVHHQLRSMTALSS
ncbi:hypothetical protein BC940DRAFT_337637 [Gongronella butleri]|nr:hypothetical protein BC940DRAFT_337637 [Gongronella butleri]